VHCFLKNKKEQVTQCIYNSLTAIVRNAYALSALLPPWRLLTRRVNLWLWNDAGNSKNTYWSLHVRGGALKSLARPTSRCCRTESKVSLERVVCLCAELQFFSCYGGWKEACQATRAISATCRRELSSRFFSSKARRRRKFTPFW